MASEAEGATPGRRADRGGSHGRAADRRAAGEGRRAGRGGCARRPLRARRTALCARSRRLASAARVLRAAPGRAPGGERLGPGGARPGRVATGGGDPRRTAPPQAERRARRARLRARGCAGVDRAVIRWEDAPGPYEVAFSTREGGVSEG